jgi:hypothetical protein
VDVGEDHSSCTDEYGKTGKVPCAVVMGTCIFTDNRVESELPRFRTDLHTDTHLFNNQTVGLGCETINNSLLPSV